MRDTVSASMTIEELFDALDADRDGILSRTDLRSAAIRLGWSWREGPILAVLDLLTLPSSITRDELTGTLNDIFNDPDRPFGDVLLKVTRRAHAVVSYRAGVVHGPEPVDGQHIGGSLRQCLRDTVGEDAAGVYGELQLGLEARTVSVAQTALLVIDPQHSFIEGAWMRSIGDGAGADVEPLRLAFEACADLLHRLRHGTEVMLTRCPFPADSYGWAASIAAVLDETRPYFVKPGNSVLWPPTNGFAEALDVLVQRGIRTLVIGGCTLNSCVRVSAVEVQRRFGAQGLQVVVDLHICGARARNYAPSSLFGRQSPVAAAVREMQENGVVIVQEVEWCRDR